MNSTDTELESIITEFQQADLSKISIDFFVQKLTPIFEKYCHTSISPKSNMKLYRVRNLRNQRPENVCELTYPRDKNKISLGRANFAKSPVFYCSGEASAALFEVPANVGDILALSTWTLNKETALFPLGYGRNFFKLGSKRNLPVLFPDYLKKIHESTSLNIKTRDFFDDIFTRTGKNESYAHTAAIANFFLNLNKKSGIVYPSIATNGNFENIALTIEAADNNLILNCVDLLKVLHIEETSKLYTCEPLTLSKVFSSEGDIIWGKSREIEGYRIIPRN